MKCEHKAGAVCWLCSDARPWWREARIAAELGEEPLNIPPVNRRYKTYRRDRFGPCAVVVCSRPAAIKGLCEWHYHQHQFRRWTERNREPVKV